MKQLNKNDFLSLGSGLRRFARATVVEHRSNTQAIKELLGDAARRMPPVSSEARSTAVGNRWQRRRRPDSAESLASELKSAKATPVPQATALPTRRSSDAARRGIGSISSPCRCARKVGKLG
jgi:hypothetical protein